MFKQRLFFLGIIFGLSNNLKTSNGLICHVVILTVVVGIKDYRIIFHGVKLRFYKFQKRAIRSPDTAYICSVTALYPISNFYR